MDEFERTVRSVLSEHAGSVSGSDDLPATTIRRGRIRRATIALTATLSVLAAGVGTFSVAAALRDDRAPDVRVVNPPPPSHEASETPATPPTATTTPPAAAADAIRQKKRGNAISGFVRAHDSIWATDTVDQEGTVSSLLYRLTDAGTLTTTIHLSRYLRGAYVWLDPVADDEGIWLAVNAKVTARTEAVGRCASVARSGEDRTGGDVLLRLDGRTNCPTHLIEAGPSDEEAGSASGQTIRSMTYSTGAVWLLTGDGLRRVDPSTSALTAIDDRIYRTVAAGFGSLWASLPRNESNESILRLDPRDGRVLARIDSDLVVHSFAFGEGSVWAATDPTERPQSGAFPYDGNGAIVQIDPSKNRIVREIRNIGSNDHQAQLTVHDGNVYACYGIAITRLDARGSDRRHSITLRYGDRPRQIIGCRVFDGTLWVGIIEFGLYHVDTARAAWKSK